MIFKIIIALLVFMLAVVVHEFGHFYGAKKSKIKVNEFAVGMGPKIFSKQNGETLYSLRALPLGGFCAMEGEDEGEISGTFEETGNFNQASIWGRIFTIIAGPLSNFILAFVILIVMFAVKGVPTAEISAVSDNSVASKVGIVAGDRITKVGNENISNFNDIKKSLSKIEKNSVNITFVRNGVEKEVEISFENSQEKILGIQSKLKRNISLVLNETVGTFNYLVSTMFDIIGKLFTGKVGIGQLSGPIGVIGAVSNSVSNGLYSLLFMTAFLSVNLGFINLLPIPALDGGRLVFLFIELILGRPISREKEGYVHTAGFIFLMGLILFVTFKDIVRLNLF